MSDPDPSTDPRWLGTEDSDEDVVREQELSHAAAQVRQMLDLFSDPRWPLFEKRVQARREVVFQALTTSRDWETTCRLQGRLQALDWVASLRESEVVALESILQELGEVQDRLEER